MSGRTTRSSTKRTKNNTAGLSDWKRQALPEELENSQEMVLPTRKSNAQVNIKDTKKLKPGTTEKKNSKAVQDESTGAGAVVLPVRRSFRVPKPRIQLPVRQETETRSTRRDSGRNVASNAPKKLDARKVAKDGSSSTSSVPAGQRTDPKNKLSPGSHSAVPEFHQRKPLNECQNEMKAAEFIEHGDSKNPADASKDKPKREVSGPVHWFGEDSDVPELELTSIPPDLLLPTSIATESLQFAASEYSGFVASFNFDSGESNRTMCFDQYLDQDPFVELDDFFVSDEY